MELKTFVKENTWLNRAYMDFGWGNGYVIIPNGHYLHGKDYTEIHELLPQLNVNGGLTFSESSNDLKDWDELQGIEDAWVVGFDTAHGWDTLDRWSKSEVESETEKLANQIK